MQYEEDLQHYLKVTGLQASDLVKTKKSKNKDKESKQHQLHLQQQQQQQQAAAQQQHQQQAAAAAQQQQQQQQAAQQHLNQMAAVNPFMAASGQPMGNFPGNMNGPVQSQAASTPQSLSDSAMGLPHFSQVWAGQPGQPSPTQTSRSPQADGAATQPDGSASASPAPGVWQWHNPMLQLLASQQHAALALNVNGQGQTVGVLASPQSQLIAEGKEGGNEATPPAPSPSTQQENSEEGTNERTDSNFSPSEAKHQVESKDSEGRESNSESAEQYSSSHAQYNSYAVNPWSGLPVQVKLQGEGGRVCSKQNVLQSEVEHLREALSEKTREAQRLTEELEKAYTIIEQLRQAHSTVQSRE